MLFRSKNPHLRLLHFNFRFQNEEIRKSQDDVIRWFNSICESITSKSLIVEVRKFSREAGICNKIQDTILALNARIESLSVHLFNENGIERKRMQKVPIRKLFPKLYEMGIVIEKLPDNDDSVRRNSLISKLPC